MFVYFNEICVNQHVYNFFSWNILTLADMILETTFLHNVIYTEFVMNQTGEQCIVLQVID